MIEIYDVLGKRVKSEKFDSNEVKLNVSSLASGTYMIRVQTNAGSQFVKILKQ